MSMKKTHTQNQTTAIILDIVIVSVVAYLFYFVVTVHQSSQKQDTQSVFILGGEKQVQAQTPGGIFILTGEE